LKNYPATLAILATSVVLECLCQLMPSLRATLALSLHLTLRSMAQLVTYQLSHGGWEHLLGNFAFGLPFMLFLEKRLGRNGFLKFYFATGVASALGHYLMTGSQGMLIGSSGSIFGVMVGACMAFGETVEEHLLALGYMLALLLPQIAMAPIGAMLGIAVYGHVCGGLAGLCLSHRMLRAPRAH
jgi:membrane associated rhomboid family serine protease